METPTPTCKSPLCHKAHHQYPNHYPFPWMGKSQYLCHLERSNSGFMMTPMPHQQPEVILSQLNTLDLSPLHHLTVPLPQFIGGSHQEGDTRFCFHPQLRTTPHQYNQQAIRQHLAEDVAHTILSHLSSPLCCCRSPVTPLLSNHLLQTLLLLKSTAQETLPLLEDIMVVVPPSLPPLWEDGCKSKT
jgi:hypothetical protein